MADEGEVIYSNQGRFSGLVACSTGHIWGLAKQSNPRGAAERHNRDAHGGRLAVRRVHSVGAP
jgi:hypothetical protein